MSILKTNLKVNGVLDLWIFAELMEGNVGASM